ncbi:MAG: hypothetical protein WC382_02820 [Methanoregulaceae archaeon]|jgi:hypothetical protein
MRYQNKFNPDALMLFLIDAQEEILELIRKKSGERVIGESAGGSKFFMTFLSSFVGALNKFSGNHEIRAAIIRRHLECGRTLGIIPENHSNDGIFYDMLDEKSRSILPALGAKGYATLGELGTAAQSTKYEVLQRLREVINPRSIRRSGKPFAVFMGSGRDPLTREKILFSWWLNEGLSHEPGAVEVPFERERIFLTAELAGLDLPAGCRQPQRLTMEY